MPWRNRPAVVPWTCTGCGSKVCCVSITTRCMPFSENAKVRGSSLRASRAPWWSTCASAVARQNNQRWLRASFASKPAPAFRPCSYWINEVKCGSGLARESAFNLTRNLQDDRPDQPAHHAHYHGQHGHHHQHSRIEILAQHQQ